jgi:uncharacterized iron-regulated membrane protein
MFHLITEVMGVWVVVALVTGLELGALIQRSERLRTEEFLNAVFSYLSHERFVG